MNYYSDWCITRRSVMLQLHGLLLFRDMQRQESSTSDAVFDEHTRLLLLLLLLWAAAVAAGGRVVARRLALGALPRRARRRAQAHLVVLRADLVQDRRHLTSQAQKLRRQKHCGLVRCTKHCTGFSRDAALQRGVMCRALRSGDADAEDDNIAARGNSGTCSVSRAACRNEKHRQGVQASSAPHACAVCAAGRAGSTRPRSR